MRKIFVKAIISILVFVVAFNLNAQEPSKTELKEILRKFKNYRFGNVALYEISNKSDFVRALKSEQAKLSGEVNIDETAIQGIDQTLLTYVEKGVNGGENKTEIAKDLIDDNIYFEQEDLDKAFNYYESKKKSVTSSKLEHVYVVTMKPEKGKIPSDIICMITSEEESDDLEENLKIVGKDDIYLFDDLKNFELDSTYSANNMYDLILNSFIQMNVKNMTGEMKGLGKRRFYYTPEKFGITKPIAQNEANYYEEDIQAIVKISNGDPIAEMGLLQNKVELGPDFIRWEHYALPLIEDDYGELIVDSAEGNSNYFLPEYGLEIKYGADNINYQSFWSERLTAYALWKSAKLGIILPTAGWSNLSTDLFDQSRKMTNAGVGVAGEFDFPIKIIPKSGLFRLSFGYVFGDAVEADYKNRDLTIDYAQFNDSYIDYLVRSDFTFHYTFALAVDLDYQFRFGFGVSGYDVERWYYKQITNENEETELNYQLLDDDFIFGLSGRAEFMAVNLSTPFGAYIQYFDEALSGKIWLQIPLYQNRLALKLEAKAFSPLFRDEHPWEVGSLFTPMARFIVTF